MVDKTIDANGFGAFYENVGQNGTNDKVTVNIGVNFSGTITVDSQPSDGEYDDTIVNIPAGWTLKVVKLVEDRSIENPAFKDYSYEVINADGQSVGTLSIRSNNIQDAPCFVRGTLIETEFGLLKIEDLHVGTRVWTRDNGLQAIRWIGSREIDLNGQEHLAHLKPIRIEAGALGNETPSQALFVSPQHRVLVRSSIAQKMFGTAEVLVAAKQLLQLDGFDIVQDAQHVEYFHMLFDHHQIVLSNGAETESLYTGPEALKSLGRAAREEIFEIFPELNAMTSVPEPARLLPSGRQARTLAVRHKQNGRQLVS